MAYYRMHKQASTCSWDAVLETPVWSAGGLGLMLAVTNSNNNMEAHVLFICKFLPIVWLLSSIGKSQS